MIFVNKKMIIYDGHKLDIGVTILLYYAKIQWFRWR